MHNLSGKEIKGYQLKERIAAGGFGAVYRAYQSTVGREVAVKVILPGLANKPDFVRRFEAEAQLIAQLEHMNIVPLYDYWRDPYGAYLIMRYLRGGSLHDYIKKNGALSIEDSLNLFSQVAQGLHIAHRNQVIHRDIKPGNILLDEDGNGYLADFGIAKDHTVTQSITGPDSLIGSSEYLAPEQARSEPVTPQTDIYSLGVVLYEMLAGEHPFPNLEKIAVIFKHLNETLPEITTLDDSIRNEINDVIYKATAKDPTQRFSDVLEMLQAFREAAKLDVTITPTSIVELLTPREQEVMQLIIDGKTNREIAEILVLAEGTVKTYITSIYRKLKVRSRVQAIVRARDLNFVIQKPQTSVKGKGTTGHLPEPENPYKGLQAFQAADAQDYFGREKLIQKVLSRLQQNETAHRFLALVGPSGSGKSSLVKAGVIPALWRGDVPGSENWYIVDLLPGAHPIDELEVALFQIATDKGMNLREQLERDKRGLIRIADMILPGDKSELLLVIDQFEEVFTLLEDEDERVHFLNLLQEAVTDKRSRVHVVLTLRADYYDRPLQYPDFGELIRSRVETVLPLSAEELERSVREPASRVGVTFEDGLISKIVSDVHYQPGALPLLQYALTELFERRNGRLLTLEAYQAIGGTGGALAKRADEIYLEGNEEGQELVRQLFLRLVTLGEGAEDTRRRVNRAEFLEISSNPELMEEIIDNYANSRLLSLDHDPATRQPTVEVAHEAILREWERLRQWLSESREDIRQERLIAQATKAWLNNNRDISYLLTGSRLEQAGAWHETTQLSLIPLVEEYIKASSKQHEIEKEAELERIEREKAQERRSHTLLRALVAVFAVATILSGGFGLLALDQRNEARQSANITQSLLLISSAREIASNGDMDLALSLAVQANLIDDAPAQAHSTLSELAFAPGTRHVYEGHESPIWTVDISPDGRYIISGGGDWRSEARGDTRLFLWDLETGEILRYFEGHTDVVVKVSFSPDGRFLLSSSVDKTIRIWDVETGEEIRQLKGNTELATAVFSPDNRIILSGSDDLSIRLWDVETGEEIRRFEGGNSAVNWEGALAFTPDGTKAITGHWDGSIYWWDVATGEQIRRVQSDSGLMTLAVSFDGQYLVTGLENGTLALWNLRTGEYIRPLVNGHTLFVTGVSFSPDDNLVASVGADGFLILWDVQTGEIVQRYLGHSDGIPDVTFVPGGRQIITASVDYTLRLWDISSPLQLQRFELHGDAVRSISLSPDGQLVASAGGRYTPENPVLDNSLRLWEIDTGQELFSFDQHKEGILATAFSPDGKSILSGSWDAFVGSSQSTLILWDVQTQEILQRFIGHFYSAEHVAFSSDGSKVFSNGYEGVILWDVLTGQEIRRFTRHSDISLSYVNFNFSVSPDDNFLAVTFSDGAIILWNIETGRQVRHFGSTGDGHNTFVQAIDFSPDGRRLLTGSDDETLILWDVHSGEIIRRFEGHTSPIRVVRFSPDGNTALSGSTDASLIWWDIGTGNIIRHFSGHDSNITDIIFQEREDGSLIALSASFDHTVIVWELLSLTQDELLSWVYTNRYVRELTCGEREQFHLMPSCNNESTSTSDLPPASNETTIPSPSPTVTPNAAGRGAQVGENRGEIGVTGGEAWHYEGQGGEVLAIIVRPDQPTNPDQEPFDALLFIHQPDGRLLAINDNAFPPAFSPIDEFTTDAGISDVELPVDGTYKITVHSNGNDIGGNYSLIIESSRYGG